MYALHTDKGFIPKHVAVTEETSTHYQTLCLDPGRSHCQLSYLRAAALQWCFCSHMMPAAGPTT